MVKPVIFTTIFAVIGAVIQSTLLAHLRIMGAAPDLALCVLLYSAYKNGSMTGQCCGFTSGLCLDFLSAAPLGFNAFFRTILGVLTGKLKNAFNDDKILFPMLICAVGTLLKAGLIFILHIIFPSMIPTYDFNGPLLWVELGCNTLLAPFLFAFLDLFSTLRSPDSARSVKAS
jgi:rod shape-determining protein MreD